MTAVNWSHREGRAEDLAWRFDLVDDADEDWMVADEERESWGSFQLWVDGVDLCAHTDQGEVLQSTHWYLLPLAEWLCSNWDAIFHEQLLPVPGASCAAAAARRAQARLDAADGAPPAMWGLSGGSGDDSTKQLQEWSQRHRLSAAIPEAPAPDVWLRRQGEFLEVSLESTDTTLFGGHVRWSAIDRVALVALGRAQRACERALRALLLELVDRTGRQSRAARALAQLDDACTPDRRDRQLAWLVGLHGHTGSLDVVREAVDEIDPFVGSADDGGSVLHAVPVATLFGSLSPTVADADVRLLVSALRTAEPSTGLGKRLEELASEAPAAELAGLHAGEAGGELGDRLSYHLRRDGDVVDIFHYLRDELGVTVTSVPLTDQELRAVTLLHDDGRVVIAVNSQYERGEAAHVVRFTLAHELAHLIYDRVRASRLAIASGPWTPVAVERRAGGFAAALLMPRRQLAQMIERQESWPSQQAQNAMALDLSVSRTSLVDRLQNADLITEGQGEQLLDR